MLVRFPPSDLAVGNGYLTQCGIGTGKAGAGHQKLTAEKSGGCTSSFAINENDSYHLLCRFINISDMKVYPNTCAFDRKCGNKRESFFQT